MCVLGGWGQKYYFYFLYEILLESRFSVAKILYFFQPGRIGDPKLLQGWELWGFVTLL